MTATARTSRTNLPISWLRISTGNGPGMGYETSYLCAEDKHQRCSGLISPGGRRAYLCGCDCGCNDRARTAVL